jgi:hypothetical protein
MITDGSLVSMYMLGEGMSHDLERAHLMGRDLMILRIVQFQSYELLVFGIFHFIFSDNCWLWVAETSESETSDMGHHYTLLTRHRRRIWSRSDDKMLFFPAILLREVKVSRYAKASSVIHTLISQPPEHFKP